MQHNVTETQYRKAVKRAGGLPRFDWEIDNPFVDRTEFWTYMDEVDYVTINKDNPKILGAWLTWARKRRWEFDDITPPNDHQMNSLFMVAEDYMKVVK